MKKFSIKAGGRMVLFMLVFVLFLSSGLCGCMGSDSTETIENIGQLHGKNIGLTEGSSDIKQVEDDYPDSNIMLFMSYSDMILALKNGRIDAYIADEPVARYQVEQTSGLRCIDEMVTHDEYAFVIANDNAALQMQIDRALSELKSDGTLDRLKEKWIVKRGEALIAKKPDADASNGTLKVITSLDVEPFSYVKDGKVIGYDIELIYMVAEKLGYAVDLVSSDFSGVLPSITTGKTDIAVGCISVTPERAKSVFFTQPVYTAGTVAIVPNRSADELSFFKRVSGSFQRTFILEERWKLVLDGLLVTIEISLISLIAGTVLGFFASFPLRSQNRTVRRLSSAVSSALDGLPSVVILMLLYYVIFNQTKLPGMLIGAFGFSIDFANSVAALLNSGIASVDKGQIKAAASLGYGKRQIFTKITFPQVARNVFSQYNGAAIGLVKGTAIVGYIAVQDLTRAGDIIRSRTYEAFFPIIAIAVIYFVLAKLIVAGLKCVGVRLEPKSRPRRVRGVNNQ